MGPATTLLRRTISTENTAPPAPLERSKGVEIDPERAGNREAFDRLMLHHQDAVVNAVTYYLQNHEDALDVAQETFLKAYRGLARFRGQCSFRAWILRIALNTARSLRARRRSKKRGGGSRRVLAPWPSTDSSDAGDPLGRIPDPDTSSAPGRLLERKEVKEAIEQAIVGLDDDAREIIILRDISGKSYESIAAALDLPMGTVKSRVYRARLELREKMAPYL